MTSTRIWAFIAVTAACCSCNKPPVPNDTVESQSRPVSSTSSDAPTSASSESRSFFINVAPQAGLTEVLYCGGVNKDHILESTGAGAAFVDFDEDGRLDVYLVNAYALDEEPSQLRMRGRNVLYRNLGNGRFEDVTEKAHLAEESWGCGVSAADYDNDGHVDLYVTNFGPNRLYRNLGNGTFEEVAVNAGVADPGWSIGSAFFDADRDGDLDLYVANYIDCKFEDVFSASRNHVWERKLRVMNGPFGMRGGRDRFYRNQGDGQFIDATDEVGMTDVAESYGMGVVASDLDNDGDVDVYVANDSNPNFLYRNDGSGKFTEVGSWTGAALSADGAAQGSMGVDAADFNGDGVQELFVTNFARDYSTFYHNAGNLLFEDVSRKMRLDRATFLPMGWGCAFFDYDLDGDLDLVQINGHIYPQVDSEPSIGESYRQVPLLFQNNQGSLEDISQLAFETKNVRASGRGLAVGDYDDDGDLDLLMTAMDSPAFLLRNDSPRKGHWLKLRVLNRHGSPAIGSRVKITVNGSDQWRELRSGSTYQSQNALELHFGLGDISKIDLIEITWSDGKSSRMSEVTADETIVVRQQ